MTPTTPKCRLCKKNDANQTGSHILTAWLVASVYTKGEKKRDNEIMFEMAPFDSNLPFIGRNVSPDTIEEHLGRALTDEEIKNQENKLVLDNLLCTNCEKRFQVIEDEYLNKVHKDLEKLECNDPITIDSSHSYTIRLFFLSQVWRASASNILNFSLDPKFEERIRLILDEILDLKIKDTLKKANDKSKMFTEIPICIIKSSKDIIPTSKPIMFSPTSNKPYFGIINDYAIMLYEKESHTRSTPHDFYGIGKYFKKEWINLKEEKFQFGFLNINSWDRVKNKFVDAAAKQRLNNLITLFKAMHEHKFKKKPSQETVQKFINSALNNDLKLGVKYLKGNLLKAMNDSLK
jgi:hypothetical protein